MTNQLLDSSLETIQKWRKQIRWYFYSLLIWPLIPVVMLRTNGISAGFTVLILSVIWHGRQISKEEYFSREVRLMRVVAWIGLFFGTTLFSAPLIILGIKFGWDSVREMIPKNYLLGTLSLLTIHASIAYLLAIWKLKKIYELEVRITGKTKQPGPLFEKKDVIRGLIAFAVVIVCILLFAWLYATVIEPRL
jgi:phosphotransferase system  glucose/maltose/N-acetylglucosamine-specific IIC component